MNLVMCAVRDAKSDQFGNPFCMQSVGVAIRSFDDEVNRAAEENMMFKYPQDFSLWHIADYDNTTSTITQLPTPKLLIQGDQVKKGQEHKISKV